MITVDLPMEEAKLLFDLKTNEELLDTLLVTRPIIKLNDLSVVVVNLSTYQNNSSNIWGYRNDPRQMVRMDLESVRLIIPKEQLDAEEAVEKAKASLEAAQKVLESVKGKNN